MKKEKDQSTNTTTLELSAAKFRVKRKKTASTYTNERKLTIKLPDYGDRGGFSVSSFSSSQKKAINSKNDNAGKKEMLKASKQQKNQDVLMVAHVRRPPLLQYCKKCENLNAERLFFSSILACTNR